MKIAVNKNQVKTVSFVEPTESDIYGSQKARIHMEFVGDERRSGYYEYESKEEALDVYEKLKQQLGLTEIEL